MVHHFFVILMEVVAVSFLLGGLDDAFIDGYYWIRLLFRRLFLHGKIRPIRQQRLCSLPEKWIAIWIPAWHESEVIGQMLSHTLQSLTYEKYEIFVGTYPNDVATQDAVEEVRQRHPQVRKIVCPNPGPTNKADCLNWIAQGMLLAEQETGRRYHIVVLHDAEDIVHPLELKLFNWLIPRKDMVQLPVIPIERPWNFWTAGTYLDEFAENHLKDLLVRERLARAIPSAGVGTAISRAVLDQLAEKSKGQLFNINSLTEDYEFGCKLAGLKRTGILAQFRVARTQHVPRGWFRKHQEIREVRERVAVREFFPDRFRLAVIQKSRWVLGICLQGWKHLGWSGGAWDKYMFYRDRRTLYTNIVNALGYVVLLYWLACVYIYGPQNVPSLIPSRWLWYVVLADTLLMVHRLLQRFIAVKRIANWHQAFLSLPRAVVGNVINFVATAWAVKQFLSAEHTGKRIAWQKTAHAFPTVNQLREYRRRLGDLLLENRLVTLAQLRCALVKQQGNGAKLGQILVQAGYLSEEDLLRVLSRQVRTPLVRIDRQQIDYTWMRKIPRDVVENWLVLPLRIKNSVLEVACADPLKAGIRDSLEALVGMPVSLQLAGEAELRLAICSTYAAVQEGAGRLLGELLLDMKVITQTDLDRALALQKLSRRKVGEILQDLGCISAEKLADALERQAGIRETERYQRI